ncbi:MAG: S-methyl-5'-thioadenosine phosphorylase [Candidatus Lokiarchaeota archaeon]|nr:S-methyl-5'-thioadenosine phosphorylase [Candidatus Lokiarchaeota archaeon]
MKYEESKVAIGIIGGTGSELYLEDMEEIKSYTPYGRTSDHLKVGRFAGKKIAFLTRHGMGHDIPPHKLNFRANMWALKNMGVKFVISPSAVGSLKIEHQKGKFILVDQYIDRTKNRKDSFYEGGQVCHIRQAEPYCSYLNDLFFESGKNNKGMMIQKGGTYVCIEGPRFSTRAESKLFRKWEADVVGMTTYPEVVLAAEMEMCYCCVAMVTDLDVWAGECQNCGIVEQALKCKRCGNPINKLEVNVTEVLETIAKNAENLNKLLKTVIPNIDMDKDCSCHHSLEGAIL